MIDREQARRLADDALKALGQLPSTDIYLWDEIRRKPSVFAFADLTNCWIAYAGSHYNGLMASTIVAIDKVSGAVVYDGSAHDEG